METQATTKLILMVKPESNFLYFEVWILGGNVIWYLEQKATIKKIHDRITQ